MTTNQPLQFFYIRRNSDNSLLHGIAHPDSRRYPPIPIFKSSVDYSMARRFSTAENAVLFAKQYGVEGVSVIDRLGHIVSVIVYDREAE